MASTSTRTKIKVPRTRHEFVKTAKPSTEKKIMGSVSEELVRDLEKNRGKQRKNMLDKEQTHAIKQIENVFLTKIEQAKEGARTMNRFLFKLAEDVRLISDLRDGTYKITITNKNPEGIECALKSENGYTRMRYIENDRIMRSKDKRDQIHKLYEGGRAADFLNEFKYNDSCIIKVKDQRVELVKPESILEEEKAGEGKFLDRKGGRQLKNKVNFLSESKNNSSTFMKDTTEIAKKGKRHYRREIERVMEEPEKTKEELKMVKEELEMNREGKDSKNQEKVRELMTAFLKMGEGLPENEYDMHNLMITFLSEKEKILKKQEKVRDLMNIILKKEEKLAENQENIRNLMAIFLTDPDIPIYIHKGGDIDNQAALFLLRKCPGYNPDKQVITIEQGEEKNIDVGIFLDIGETTNGVEASGKKLILSEHKKNTNEAAYGNRPNSTTHMLHKIMKYTKMLSQKELPQMEKFVEFADQIDGFEYQAGGIDYKNSYKTLIGLSKKLIPTHIARYNIERIYNYFSYTKATGFEELGDEFMKKIRVKNRKGNVVSLKEISEEKNKDIQKSIKKFKELKAQGYELMYKGTPFIVDISRNIADGLKDGPKVAGANKDEEGKSKPYGFFKIHEQRGNLYIYSPKELPREIAGFQTKEYFLFIDNVSIGDLEKLFQEFDMDSKSKEGLTEEIKDYLRWIQEKKKAKELGKTGQMSGETSLTSDD